MPLQKAIRFEDIIKQWFEEEPSLHKHMHISNHNNIELWFYFYTDCTDRRHSIAFLSKKKPLATNINWSKNGPNGQESGVYQPTISAEDPQFFEKLKSGLIVAHNSLSQVSGCRI